MDFATKTDLANLKSDVDELDKLKNVPTNSSNLKSKVGKLDVNKLIPVLVNLSKLSHVVRNGIANVYNAKIKNIEDKISDITNLATNTTLNAKINEVKNKILSITNIVTTTGLTAVENKIPNVSDLVKKEDYDTEIKGITNKYFTTSDYNKFTNNILDRRVIAKKLVNESGLNEKIKILATKEEIKKLATKAEIKAEQDKIKLQTYDLSLFISQSYFVNSGAQLYLILQPLYYTLKRLGDTENVVSWKSKSLSAKKLTSPTPTDNILSPSIKWYENSNFYLIFKGSCLKQKTEVLLLQI